MRLPLNIGTTERRIAFVFGARAEPEHSFQISFFSSSKDRPSTFECPIPTVQHLLYPRGETPHSLHSKEMEIKGEIQVTIQVMASYVMEETRRTLVFLVNTVKNYRPASLLVYSKVY